MEPKVDPAHFNDGTHQDIQREQDQPNEDIPAKALKAFVQNVLPHLSNSTNLKPAHKLSQNRGFVSLTLGIPTVKRWSKATGWNQSYLKQTLQSIFDNMNEVEAADTLVIVMIAEPHDMDHVKKVWVIFVCI